jgi:beta-lactamase superfamily II metal-dependent hydrolase
MNSMLDMLDSYTAGLPSPPPAFPGVTFNTYWNKYGATHSDTNNISFVTFLTCHGTTFLIPGDIEGSGWDALMGRLDFIADLANVDVLIASHHGRESGYSADAMAIARPKCVVCSDSAVQHATQEMSNTYRNWCLGMMFGNTLRRFVSTRNDGNVYWNL